MFESDRISLIEGSLTKPTDLTDTELRRHRQSEALPWSKSPFVDNNVEAEDDEVDLEPLQPGELRVIVPNDLPWSDFLLEVAMTTAFASLTDGTPVLLPENAISYLSFFILVWWIWVAQVAYNLRFRQADWLHRIYVFLQLVVFSVLASFTLDFNITTGLLPDDDGPLKDQLMEQLGFNKDHLEALAFREAWLPRLNARGISMTMAISRALLLLQYSIVFYHARRLKRTAILAHMIALAFSAVCYFTAFGLLGSDDDAIPKYIQIAKIGLWYTPIVVEVAAHFIANALPGHVRYYTEGINARSATVFIIILGGGLDKITGGFQELVGNTGLERDGIGLFLSAAVIFISEFSLYFNSSGGQKKLGNQRALTWFFAHFFYVAALIITKRSCDITRILCMAIDKQLNTVTPIIDWMESNPGRNTTANNFPAARRIFDKMGLSLNEIITNLNRGFEESRRLNNSEISKSTVFQQEMTIVDTMLTLFDAQPDATSLIGAKKQLFLSSEVSNTTAVNLAKFSEIYGGLLQWRGSSALWFFAASGSTLLALVLLSLIKGSPRDRWEWGSIISRLITGTLVVLLSFLSVGATKPPINPDATITNSAIWQLTLRSLILPIFAIFIGFLLVVEVVLTYLASRPYYSFEGLQFWKTGRTSHKYRNLSPTISSVPLTPYTNSSQPVSLTSEVKPDVSGGGGGALYDDPFEDRIPT